ncbi:putative RDD family membrane protein YckC [Litoreibacter meonggei]|uniref:Putative RDD family membrane protein YckC n=1 Tax=Litoreibacter meonggei TaxID=1049199 RepID=A0A497VHT8_9RHOB|nr:RDD family protein [Litoreibacter meonggei]RLJ41807.1 putative RDD family membrane protein YckC [Litoreibacter meonggei]
MSFTMNDTYDALPNPATQPAFYEGVGVKRLLAWVVDTVLIGTIAAIVASIPLFLLWFVFPLVFLVVSLIYRIGSIRAYSATPGMQLFNVELRAHDGQRLDGSAAALHTIAFMIASAFFIPQIASVFLMLMTERGQGLHDMFTGVVAINKPSRY